MQGGLALGGKARKITFHRFISVTKLVLVLHHFPQAASTACGYDCAPTERSSSGSGCPPGSAASKRSCRNQLGRGRTAMNAHCKGRQPAVAQRQAPQQHTAITEIYACTQLIIHVSRMAKAARGGVVGFREGPAAGPFSGGAVGRRQGKHQPAVLQSAASLHAQKNLSGA
jgi:hypothetical protein